MRLACGFCKARSPEFEEVDHEFTWQCGLCMKKNTWIPPKPKKPKYKEKTIKVQDLEVAEVLGDLTDIGE